MTDVSQESCSFCYRLRAYLTVAGFLIAGIYLQPDWALRLANHMPTAMTVGIGICLGAVGIFSIKLRDHIREKDGDQAA